VGVRAQALPQEQRWHDGVDFPIRAPKVQQRSRILIVVPQESGEAGKVRKGSVGFPQWDEIWLNLGSASEKGFFTNHQ